MAAGKSIDAMLVAFRAKNLEGKHPSSVSRAAADAHLPYSKSPAVAFETTIFKSSLSLGCYCFHSCMGVSFHDPRTGSITDLGKTGA